MKILLFCVSTEFKSYRLKLANQLGALKGHPYEVKVQEDFQQGEYALLEHLADYVQSFDLVIHLVGEASGAEPDLNDLNYLRNLFLFHTQDKFDNASIFGVSNTQWVYHLARCFQKKVLVYLAKPEAPRDCGWPIRQSYVTPVVSGITCNTSSILANIGRKLTVSTSLSAKYSMTLT